MVVLKFLSANPEMLPTLASSWLFVQLCTPNKANLKFGKNKSLQPPTVDPNWVYDRRPAGFAVLLRKLQHIQETNKGFLYDSPGYIFIYAEGNCCPKFDAVNKSSAGISLITSYRVPSSHQTRVHLCSLIHEQKTPDCYICPILIE